MCKIENRVGLNIKEAADLLGISKQDRKSVV